MDKILLWGGRSKARIAAAMLQEGGRDVHYIFDETLDKPDFSSDAAFGNDAASLQAFLAEATHFLVCIGGAHGYARCRISKVLAQDFGLEPLSIRSPHAVVDATSVVGQGLQIMPGAVVHKFCELGDHVVVNTNATVDHECVLGDGVHVMGGASIAGCVSIGDFASIGTNATVLPHVKIGKGAFVGAGAVVTKDVPDNHVVCGVPAHFLKENKMVADFAALKQCLEMKSTEAR